MKKSKRLISFLLSAVMIITTFLAVGPVFTIEAEAAGELWGITQTRVVSNYAETYSAYQKRFFGGTGTDNWPTTMVIPGLAQSDDYTPQGMTYWQAKEWILISAYDAKSSGKNSVIYAIDIKTGNFVALFKVFNNNGTVNTSHGGGIAASEYNFYYADKGSYISYWPLSVMDVAEGTVKNVYIRDSIDCSGELNGAATSYCCYDEGVLWTGNFYLNNDSYDYGQPANGSYNSMLFGYQLRGDSSALEWDYLCASDHPITITNYTNSSQTGTQKAYFTAEKNYLRLRFGVRNGNGATVKYSNIQIYEVGNSGTNLFNLANWASGNGGGAQGGSITNDTGSGTITINATTNDAYSNPWNGVSGNGAVKVTAGKKYCLQYNYQVSGVSSAQLEPFVFWDDDTTDNGESANYCPAFKTATDVLTMSKNDAVMTYKLTSDSNGVDITGSIKKDLSTSEGGTRIGEMAPKFASVVLDVGRKYKISYTATASTDIYMFAPNGNHCNVKQSSATKITNNGNGTYKYEMEFTTGLKPDGADSSWPTTQSTDKAYSGLYTIRFDQDEITQSRDFAITDLKIEHCHEDEHDDSMRGTDCEGNPTFCIAFKDDDNDGVEETDKIQYSMVDKGKIYISRSWSRKQGSTHTRELAIASIDIYSPGQENLWINGKERLCHVVKTSDSTYKQFGGTGNGVAGQDKMLYMGEALCIIDDYLYMFGESAAWHYNGKDSSSVCPEPIDVIWKIDQHAIIGATRSSTEDVKASHYERVDSWSDFEAGAEYIIAFESSQKDRVTQKNILYFLDSYGGYNGGKLPKHDNPTSVLTNDSMGVVGYKITSYSTDGDKLYIDEADDARKSIRWKISHNGSGANLRLENLDSYYNQNKYFNFNNEVAAMSTGNSTDITRNFLSLAYDSTAKKFSICSTNGGSASYLWCNDGTVSSYMTSYTNHYQKSSTAVYAGLAEIAGTFHVDSRKNYTTNSGNVVGTVDKSYERLVIYKRVPDPYANTAGSNVYTDLKAEVQSDGTINLNLETYATARLHFKDLSQKRATDYIIVMDKSGSTYDSGGKGWDYWDNTLNMRAVYGGTLSVEGGRAVRVERKHSDIYYRTPEDGKLRPVYCSIKDVDNQVLNAYDKQAYWVWYEDDAGLCHVFHRNNDGTSFSIDEGISYSTLQNYVKNNTNNTLEVQGNNDTRFGTTIYKGPHYASNRDVNRLRQMQNLAVQLTYDIAADAAANGLNHRIALCRVGYKPGEGDANTTTAFYKAGSTSPTALTVTSGFSSSQDFSNVFNSTSQFETVRTAINSMVTGGHSHFDYAMKTMVPGIVKASSQDYSYSGNRSLCVIMITDGGLCSVEDNLTIGGSGTSSVYGSTIMGSKDIKELGGHVFTVRVGHEDISDWDEDLNLSAVSSDYISAESGTKLGDPTPWDVDFSHAFSTSSFDYASAASTVLAQVNKSRNYALAKLDSNSILREQLDTKSFSFANVSDSDISIGTQQAKYDGAGRLYFGDLQSDASLSANLTNKANGEITVKGFDYSKNYLSTSTISGGTAKKLVVTIKNVQFADGVVNTSDVNKPIVDVAVSDSAATGIYMTSTEKQQAFPQARLTIPQYTYVLDYGIGMLDVDINGTLVSVDTQLRPQRAADGTFNNRYIETGGTKLAFANDKQDMIYSIDRTATKLQRYYVLIQRPNGEYDWFAINIVPASTVYYEENIFSNYISGNTRWSPTGNATVTSQGISLWDDVYGYDEKYLADTSNNSGGTVLTTTVSSGNKQSDTYRTNFIGDAFDLYSACGDSTGILVVGVRKNDGTNNGRGTLVKSYVVDTFYNDSAYGTLYQVPVIHCEDLAYGNYFVEITSAYLSMSGKLRSQSIATEIIDENGVISYTSDFTNDTESVILEELGFAELDPENTEFIWYSEDSVLNGGMGAQGVNDGSFTTQADGDVTLTSYIDGLRAYNPTNGVSSYYKAEEQDAKYYNVFDNMKAGTFTGNGVSYLLGGTAGGTTLNFATELESLFQGRPKNEVYLETGNKITFTVNGLDTDSRVMVSLRAAAGTPKASVNNKQFNVTSKMEMYYDVTDYVTKSSDGKSATVVIENVSGGMLAIDNIKLTGKETTLSGQSLLSDIIEIFAEPVEEVVPNQPKPQVSENSGEIPAPPEAPDNNNPEDGDDDNNNDIVPPSDDNNNPEEPAEDGFFTKVESFFVKIFNFFKNIFNKVSSFFEF